MRVPVLRVEAVEAGAVMRSCAAFVPPTGRRPDEARQPADAQATHAGSGGAGEPHGAAGKSRAATCCRCGRALRTCMRWWSPGNGVRSLAARVGPAQSRARGSGAAVSTIRRPTMATSRCPAAAGGAADQRVGQIAGPLAAVLSDEVAPSPRRSAPRCREGSACRGRLVDEGRSLLQAGAEREGSKPSAALRSCRGRASRGTEAPTVQGTARHQPVIRIGIRAQGLEKQELR